MDAHSRSKGFWGMGYSSSGNCACSLWHRKLMNLDLKQFPGLLQLTHRQWESLHSVPVSAAGHPSQPHFPISGAMQSLSFQASLFCLLAMTGLAHLLLLPELCLDLVWHLQPLLCKRQKILSLLLTEQLGLPHLPAVAGFVLFPIHKVCKHKCRPQQFRFLLACITSLSCC